MTAFEMSRNHSVFLLKQETNDYQRSVLILITPRVPVYTSKIDQSPNAAMSDSMKALREKFGFAGSTPSNAEVILHQLKTNDFFREFRQGDVTLDFRLHMNKDNT